MSGEKYGRLPIDKAWGLIEHLEAHRENAAEDVYTVLWWLADTGWDIIKREVKP